MTDYLNSLVVRTLNLGTVVQPRLASLFEPLSTAGPEAAGAWQSDSAFENPLSTNAMSDASPAPVPTRINQPVQGTVGPPNVWRHAQETASVSNEPLKRFLPPRPLATTPVQAHTPISALSPESTRRASDEEPKQHASKPSSAISSTAATDVHTRPRITPEVRRSYHATQAEQNQTSLMVPDPFASLASAAPQETVSSTAQANTQAAVPTEAPDTVVVTIGRVDVRAVFAPPAAAPRPNRSQAQPMSLDEYLKQRSEGRR